MYRIAIKMLTQDKAKYLLLVSSLTFAALLMTQQGSVFLGLLKWCTATITNTKASIWVVDPQVEQVNEVQPLRITDLSRVRSVSGVDWAVPLYHTIQQARLEKGSFKIVQVIGLDPSTLFGAPSRILEGSLSSLRQNNAVIIDEVAVEKFTQGRDTPLGIGDIFEINDREAKVVAICRAERSFFGYPLIYTTYDRAIQYNPSQRKTLSYVLVNPKPGVDHTELSRLIEKETGLKAYTEVEFSRATLQWFFKNTGIPMSFGMIILLGFLVGIAVSGQTFYSFILENLPNLGALKAMGASNWLLTRMLILQALLVGTIGYGIGVGIASLFGRMAISVGKIPFFLAPQTMLLSLAAILFICTVSALLGIRKIRKLDASEVFRG